MNNLSERDKKALLIGGGGVALILLFNYVLAPLWQRWDETGSRLESRRAFIASFRERVETRESLRDRRDVLALRLGSLQVLHRKEEVKEPEEKAGEAPPADSGPSVVPEGAPQATGQDESSDSENKPEQAAAVDAADKDGGTPERLDGEESEGADKPSNGPANAETAESAVVAKNDNSDAEDKGERGTAEETAGDTPEQGAGSLSEGEDVTRPKDAADEKRTEKDGGEEKVGEEKPKEPKRPERTPVPSIEASSLSAYVEKNAHAAKIKLKRITPKKSTTGKKRTKYFEPVTIQVNFECQITNLLQLLHDLEKGELFVRIDKVEITRDVQQGDKLNASLELSSYEPLEERS